MARHPRPPRSPLRPPPMMKPLPPHRLRATPPTVPRRKRANWLGNGPVWPSKQYNFVNSMQLSDHFVQLILFFRDVVGDVRNPIVTRLSLTTLEKRPDMPRRCPGKFLSPQQPKLRRPQQLPKPSLFSIFVELFEPFQHSS